MKLFVTVIFIVVNNITPSIPIIQVTFNRIPSRHPNRYPGAFNRPQFRPPPNRPGFQPFRRPPNIPQRPFFPPPSPPYASPQRPNFQPNFQPTAQMNRPPNNYQQMPYRNPPLTNYVTTTTETTTTNKSTTTESTTTTKHPLESVEDIHTLLSSMEEDGTLKESGWSKDKVKPMLKELWPYYKNVKSMLLEREKARMSLINLRNKYHAKRQRLRNWFHLKPFKNGVY